MTPVLCVDEPFASAILAGLKRWETRSCPPNGDMRPAGVRGFPGVRVNRGDRIIIAATARSPELFVRFGRLRVEDTTDNELALTTHAPGVVDGSRWIPLHPGHILGTVAVTDVVPIVDDCDDLPDTPRLIEVLGEPLRLWPEGAVETGESTDISDQLPWGIWDAGRWAWRLADPIPTTEQCPWCDGSGCVPARDPMYPDMTAFGEPLDPCPICDGEGRCNPIPVTGHQGLREWSGEVRS